MRQTDSARARLSLLIANNERPRMKDSQGRTRKSSAIRLSKPPGMKRPPGKGQKRNERKRKSNVSLPTNDGKRPNVSEGLRLHENLRQPQTPNLIRIRS